MDRMEDVQHTELNIFTQTKPISLASLFGEQIEEINTQTAQKFSQSIPASNVNLRSRKKRTYSGTLKDEALARNSLGPFHSMRAPLSPAIPSILIGRWRPRWTEEASNAYATLLKSFAKPPFKIHEDEDAKESADQSGKGNHKRNNSLLEWKDKERFDILASRAIR